MMLSRRTANILLTIGLYTLFVWGTRAFTFYQQLREGTMVAPAVHFTLVVIGVVIGIYLTYLGFKGRSAAPRRKG
ncbi:MAG: hypothetical protein K6T51_07245 [Rubrobacteraceae bacterium]|uniref:hypothetical protein n=1 Tax=Rubrobacter naiadicus TaxID=1392641 RepID=UPI00235F6CC1|nr:hypothetical protein [Rubrobacter naiadicus]MBX6762885.1 hypothetical protein [Rubrobacteraceae bacterium]MCL6438389.1 hypothetical protein [Rubrobacteraceae bacterium]